MCLRTIARSMRRSVSSTSTRESASTSPRASANLQAHAGARAPPPGLSAMRPGGTAARPSDCYGDDSHCWHPFDYQHAAPWLTHSARCSLASAATLDMVRCSFVPSLKRAPEHCACKRGASHSTPHRARKTKS